MDRKEFIRQYRETIEKIRAEATEHARKARLLSHDEPYRQEHRERCERLYGKADGMVEIINHLANDYVD